MITIEPLELLTVKVDGAILQLRPGEPVNLPEVQARRLLAKAGDKVRVVPEDSPPPASADPITGQLGRCRPVHWQSMDGTIHRGTCVLLGTMGTGQAATFCVGIEDEGGAFRWVHEDRLRSRAAYEAQPSPLVRPAASEPDACPCCGTRRFWLSIHGHVLCGACHPPASQELVRRWVTEGGPS